MFLGSALLKVAQTEFKLGASERELISNSAANTLLPIRRFLEGDMKTIQVPPHVNLAVNQFLILERAENSARQTIGFGRMQKSAEEGENARESSECE